MQLRQLGHALTTALLAGVLVSAAMAQETEDSMDPAMKAAEAKEFAAINAELETVAKEIAALLKHPGFRGQLRGEINGAKTTENIIVLDKFLAKVAKQEKAPPGLAKAKGATDKAVGRINASNAWLLDGIDLYFPVKDHKAKWKGNEDLIVAYSPTTDEADTKSIIGFSVKTQERVTLDPRTPPATPVLIVAPEEHENHDMPVVPRGDPMISDVDEPEDKFEIHFQGKEPEDKAVPQEQGNSFVGLHQIYIRDVKEPWTRGDPEIRVYFGQRKGSYCDAKVETHYNYPLERVNDSRRWYTTWSPPSTSVCSYNSYTCWYFADTNFGNRMVLYIYESDGGSRADKTYYVEPGVLCTWYNLSGNDYVDSGIMYKTNFPFNYTYGQDLGNAIVRWHKVH